MNSVHARPDDQHFRQRHDGHGTTIGNLGMTDEIPRALSSRGDTIRVETEIVSRRRSKSRNDAGIVDFNTRPHKQDGTLGRRMQAAGCMLQAQKA